MRLTAVLCGVLALFVIGAGKKISDYTETLSITDAWIYEIAVPGVTNYKVTFGTMATNIIARVEGGFIPSGSSVALPLSSVQFNSNGVMQGSAGMLFTNGNFISSNVWTSEDIRYWGASTGLVDNSVAIQKTIDNLPSTGGRVFVPSGDWQIATGICLFRSNVKFEGAGLGVSCIFAATNVSAPAVSLSPQWGLLSINSTNSSQYVTNISVANLTFRQNGNEFYKEQAPAVYLRKVVHFAAVSNLTMYRVGIDGGAAEALSGTGNGGTFPTASSIKIQECVFQNGKFTSFDLNSLWMRDIQISGCTFKNADFGILAIGTGLIISDNYFENMQRGAIEIGEPNFVSSGFPSTGGNIIHGNTIIGLGVGSYATNEIYGIRSHYSGPYADGTMDFANTIANNVIKNSVVLTTQVFRGIDLRGPAKCIGNYIGGLTAGTTDETVGIIIRTPVNLASNALYNVFVEGNVVDKTVTSTQLHVGLEISTAWTNAHIYLSDNRILDGSDYALLVVSNASPAFVSSSGDIFNGNIMDYRNWSSSIGVPLNGDHRWDNAPLYGNSYTNIGKYLSRGKNNEVFVSALGGAVPMEISSSNNAQTINVNPLINLSNPSVDGGAWAGLGFRTINTGGTMFSTACIEAADNGAKIPEDMEGQLRIGIMNGVMTERIRINELGNVGINTNAPGYKLEVNGTTRITGAVMLNNGSPAAGQVPTYRTDGTIYPSNVVAGATTQMVAAAIGTLTITNALSVDVLNVNQVNLTNALGSNVVRLGVNDLTNSAAANPIDGNVLAWHSGMQKWTNTIVAAADVISNVTASTTANLLFDFSMANVFKVKLLTNFSYTFTNTAYLQKKAYVYFQQDDIGVRLLNTYTVAGGILQTNANMQPTTNGNALDVMEVMPGFLTTNLVAWWPQNFQPRVPYPGSSVATFIDNFDRTTADPMTTTASGGGTWTSGQGLFGDCQIDSNLLRGSTGTENAARVLTPTFADNQSASATVVAAGSSLFFGVGVRSQSTTDGSGYFASPQSDTSIMIQKVADNGASFVYTDLVPAFTVTTLAPGDIVTLGVVGATFTLYINAVSQGTRTDATYSSGQPWMYFYNTPGLVTTFTATDL